MEKGSIHIYCGEGRGKTSAAVGQAIGFANEGKQVTIIRFLKGSAESGYDIIRRLEPEIKLFSFEKSQRRFDELTEQERQEEIQNIRNGYNFAKKVLQTGESDLLILDEFLGVFDNGLMTVEDMKSLIALKSEGVSIIMTGINVNEKICALADEITKLETIKM